MALAFTYSISTSFQNREFNEWGQIFFQRSQEGCKDGKSPFLLGHSRVLKVFENPDSLEDPSMMKDFGRDGCVYIFQNWRHSSLPKDPRNRHQAVEKLGGEDRQLQVHLMNELNPDSSLSDVDGEEAPRVWYRAPVSKIVDIALSPSLIALNTLDIPYSGVPSPSTTLDQAYDSFVCTMGTPFCPEHTPFPHQLTSWLLFSTGNTIHSMHVDSNGLSTHCLTNGTKIWFFVVDQEEKTAAGSGDYFIPHSSKNFVKMFRNPPLGNSKWELEAYVQRPGELL
jgi:hypothetical protein